MRKQYLLIITVMIMILVGSNFSVYADSAAAVSVNATLSSASVLINGKTVTFQAYNIGGSNYFKLRDLAEALDGSDKKFEVGWDDNNKSITLTSDQDYTSIGNELESSKDASSTAKRSTAGLYLDGNKIDASVYNIGGNNFFKLRDLAAALNFSVSYDSTTKMISIDTTTSYEAGTTVSNDSYLTSDYFIPTDLDKIYVYDSGIEMSWFASDTDSIINSCSNYAESNSYTIKNGLVEWISYCPGGRVWYAETGALVELYPAAPGESWISSWRGIIEEKPDYVYSQDIYGTVKKTFVGWETMEIMGQSMTVAHIHVLDQSMSDAYASREYDQWLAKGLGIVKSSGGHQFDQTCFENGLGTLVEVR